MPCPVYVTEKDDLCGAPLVVEYEGGGGRRGGRFYMHPVHISDIYSDACQHCTTHRAEVEDAAHHFVTEREDGDFWAAVDAEIDRRRDEGC